MAEQAKIERSIQLLVEGNDQKNFFEAFVSYLNIQGVQIQNFGGIHELRGFLRAFVRASGFDTVSSIGVIRDAEISAEGAFQSVRSSLRDAGLVAPMREERRAGGAPAVTVMILPGNNRGGMLETLLCKSFEETPINDCIDEFIACARKLPDTKIERLDKARACLSGDMSASARLRRRSGQKRLLAVRSSSVCPCAGVPDKFARFRERRAIVGQMRQRSISGREEIYGAIRVEDSGFGRFDFSAFAVRRRKPPALGRV